MDNETTVTGMKAAATINFLLGIWLFISPWVYGSAAKPNSWNSWIIGFVLVIFALVRIANPVSTRALAWINMLLGIWVFASPWIYGYTANSGRFINSLCVGLVVFFLSLYGNTAHVTHGPTTTVTR